MGRFNNRRTQAAAAAMRNTPSRARFSKGPPNKSKGRPTKRNDNNSSTSQGNNTDNRKRQPDAATTARVIDKLQSRQEQSQPQQRSASTEEALAFLDKSKLDHLTLDSEILHNISELLERLGVKQSSNNDVESFELQDENFDGSENGTEPQVGDLQNTTLSATASPFVVGNSYTEYDDDVEEADELDEHALLEEAPRARMNIDDENDWEGSTQDTDEESTGSEEEEETLEDDPAFMYLTDKLSFLEHDAKRACRAIRNWDAVTSTEEAKTTISSNKESIALAMDWLCLHLTEEQLVRGFKPNPNPNKREQSKLKAATTSLSTTNIKAIPHPSISLATDVISDKSWARSVRLQERILKFVRLGFSHAEATRACEETRAKDDDLDVAMTKRPPLEDPALPKLLLLLRSKFMDAPLGELLNDADLEYAREEQEQEREALEAIYEDQFHVSRNDEAAQINSYCLHIEPTEPLKDPVRSKECRLHVFLRPGYPVVETPLFCFTNHSMPPSLLRQVNEFSCKHALGNIGIPVIFEVVNALAEALPSLQLQFTREQKRKEFDAHQAALRKKAGHNVDQVIENQYGGEKLGRRQRGKLKSAEKAYDRGEQEQKEWVEKVERQKQRVEKAQEDNARVRQVHVEITLRKREENQIQEEAERLARAAMNAAFNRGESVEQARAAAENARVTCLEEHGVGSVTKDPSAEIQQDLKYENEEDESTAISDTTQKTAEFMGRLRATVAQGTNAADTSAAESPNIQETTPTTAAFMERLRHMYDSAAQKKAGFHLAAPKKDVETEDEEASRSHVPRPVAIPNGELGEVMTDILQQQQEQPWLVSPEARVPTLEAASVDEALSTEQEKKQSQTSKRLKEELEGKLGMVTQSKSRNTKDGEKYKNMLSVRKRLPAFIIGKDVVETIATNQITVIAGDTGCGKTTQVPQLVLDDRILKGQGANTNIIVTQPRRISAIGVSERIADERVENVGETCGYSIKLEKKISSKTRLLLCTTGILLRRLQCDPDLASVSHVFVDEVHERDLNTDFLIIILRDLLARRKNLKLILMSATLNAEAFSDYFNGCPIVSIPGRAHPVQENRLEDILEITGYQVQEDSDYALKTNASKPAKISKSMLRKMYHPKYSKETIHSLSIVDETVINYELVASLLEHIALHEDEGAILVFMPGMMEITKTIEELHKKEYFQSDKVRIYPLHSSLTTAEQTAIFQVPPNGVRKIVISTNIAETSITIEDVVYVVDSGKVKENRRDEMNETPTLEEVWVSRASAKQRRGRAGRVRPGIAYHLYSTHTNDNELMEYQLPEMLRVGIEDLVLQVLVLDLGEPSSFLGKALNPPSELAMSNSLKLLETLGAVECKWAQLPPGTNGSRRLENDISGESCGGLKVSSELTALGFHLATLPVDPRVGKLMIYGSLLGCVDPALTIAASLSSRSPFVSPFDQREAADEARKTFAVDGSDHLSVLNAFNQWKALKGKGNRTVNAFLKENFLGRLTLHQMEDLRSQFARLLKEIGFLPSSFQVKNPGVDGPNSNADNVGLLKAVLCAGLYPNILVAPRTLIAEATSSRKAQDKMAGECAFQSRKGEVYLHPSTIAFDRPYLDSRYSCYHEIVKTSKVYARDTSTVSPFALLLFGGSLKVYQAHGVCTVDDWLKFKIDAKPATLIKFLRHQMEKMLLKKVLDPQDEIVQSAEGRALIESISIIFANNKECPFDAEVGPEIYETSLHNGSEDKSSRRNGNRRNNGGHGGQGRGKGNRDGGREGRGRGRGGRDRGQGRC